MSSGDVSAQISGAGGGSNAPQLDERYRCGSLFYTKASLAALFGWMIMANLCFGLFEGNGGAGSIPLYLQENFHVSNFTISIIFNFIPMIIGTVMTPIISFKSDRTRTRRGRRIPYILYTAPFLVLFAVLLGFCDDIVAACKLNMSPGSYVQPLTAALLIIGFLTIGWSFFNEFVGTVFYYLTPDVMPSHFLGRFQALSSVAGTFLNIFMNTYVNPHQLTHIKAIHVGVAILYFVGFGLVCWRVKEGQYPPVEDVTEKTSFFDQVKLYFKECFNHPIYIMIYMVTAIAILARGVNPAGIFALHIGQHQGRINAHGGEATAVAMSPDSKTIISAGSDGSAKLWNCSDRKKPELVKTLEYKDLKTKNVAISPDAKTAVFAFSDGSLETVELSSGKELSKRKAHEETVNCVAFSEDGSKMASCSDDKLIKVWNLSSQSPEPLQVLQGHEGPVNSVSFSNSGDMLVSGSSDKKIIVWNLADGKIVKTMEGSPGPVRAVCFAPEIAPADQSSKKDAAGSHVQSFLDKSWRFIKNVFVNESLYSDLPDSYSQIVGEDRWIISGGMDGENNEVNSGLRIWDLSTGQLIPAVEALKTKSLKGHKKTITAVAYKPDIRCILSASLDESVRLWRPLDISGSVAKAADDQSFKTFSGYTRGVSSMACQSKGVILANSSIDGTLHIWDIDQGISLEKANRYKGNFIAIIALLLAYPLGALIDRLNPVKITLWTTFLTLPVSLLYFFLYRDYVSSLWIDLIMLPLNTLCAMALLPMMVMLYPKTKYGQFSSANAMVRQFVSAFAGILGAMLMDHLTVNSFDTDNYRYGFLFRFVFNSASFACLIGVYYYWRKLGGEKFVAPEHQHKV